MQAIKRVGKAFICRILEHQVKRLRRRHEFKIVAVAGSVGKTSTKLAIAKTLAASQHVIYQDGNYNDRLTVPLVLFGHSEPGIFNVFAWIRIIFSNGRVIRGDYPYKYAVLELGTDAPGSMSKFAYLKPEVVVLTAIAAEHMEYFKTLQGVADEELAVFNYAQQILVNVDDVSESYLKGREYLTFSISDKSDFYAHNIKSEALKGSTFSAHLPNNEDLRIQSRTMGLQGIKISLAAVAATHLLGISPYDIINGVAAVEPVAGRLRVLRGIKASTIIDDSYNASPTAVEAGLDILYSLKSDQRIAILGSMNELGDFSAEAHREVGSYCDPAKLSLVVTIGAEAEQNLAPAAIKAGCSVKSFQSPYDAGLFVVEQVDAKDTLILAEGSQNRIFTEEAVKLLLADKNDASKLVRQSGYWLGIKARQFPH
ncbi:MAG: UDP-N-acetylmuramoyl-tripeptide--D-alanyl-D-alanine ligase [Candidatus Saccharibacteria bacterium]